MLFASMEAAPNGRPVAPVASRFRFGSDFTEGPWLLTHACTNDVDIYQIE